METCRKAWGFAPCPQDCICRGYAVTALYMATLSLKNIKKIYDKNVVAVHDFNLEIADKEFIVLVGPSGCGKSTTLRMIAGLEDISDGDLFIGDVWMNDVEPKDRDIAMVFQNYALYPHMTVYENMAFALKLRKTPQGRDRQKGPRGRRDPRYHHLPGAQAQGAVRRPAPACGPSAAPSCVSPRSS